MTLGEQEIQRMVIGAFRDSAAHGGFTCACELFGYDREDELSERYLIDTESVPDDGPVSVVIYNLGAGEAWEVEVNFNVRNVSNLPHYQRIFAEHRERQEADSCKPIWWG